MYSITAKSSCVSSVQPAEDEPDQNEGYTCPSGEEIPYLYSFVVFIYIVNQLLILYFQLHF